MRIGITFDLREEYAWEGYDEEDRAEFDEIETVLAIEDALHALGHATDRIGNARSLLQHLVRGDRWQMVFNIAEGMHGFGRQALVPALLDAYRIPYTFSDPLALSVMLHKGTAKHIVRDQGIRTADFAVVETAVGVERLDLPFPLFIKPIAEGTSKGISIASKVCEQAELQAGCERLLSRFRQAVLVERYLPGREFTVGVLGTGASASALGVMEIITETGPDAGIYSYENKKHFSERVGVRLAHDDVGLAAMQVALAAWLSLGGRDGGRVDVRCDAEGNLNFIEANPLAGLHPADSDLPLLGRLKGMPYVALIGEIIASASNRAGLPAPPKLPDHS